jgi:hypothetical protein
MMVSCCILSVRGDEILVHRFESESKWKSTEWHHATSPRKEKFRGLESPGKSMVTIFGIRKVFLL